MSNRVESLANGLMVAGFLLMVAAIIGIILEHPENQTTHTSARDSLASIDSSSTSAVDRMRALRATGVLRGPAWNGYGPGLP